MSKEASPVALSTAKVALPLIVTAGAAVGTLAGPKLWKGLKELCWTRVEGSTTDEDRCSLCGGALADMIPHPHGKVAAAFADITIARCASCGFERALPWPTNAQLGEFYNKFYQDRMARHYAPTPLDPAHFAALRAAAQASFIRDAAAAAHGGSVAAFEAAVRVVAEGGAGWGRLLREFAFGEAARGRALHMYEYEEEAIAYARDVECAGGAASFVGHVGDCKPGDAAAGELAAGSVDLVLSSHVIEHIPRPHLAVADWATMLKPGGLLFIEGPLENPHPLNCGAAYLGPEEDPYYGGHINFFTPAQYIKLVENAGLELIRIETCMEPVNPVLNEPTPNPSPVFNGQDRICKLMCRKPARS